MARHASAVVAAELRMVQSRRELRDGLRRLRRRLTRPSSLAAAAALGAFLGFALTRRGRMGAVAGALTMALIRHGAKHVIAGAVARPKPPSVREPTDRVATDL